MDAFFYWELFCACCLTVLPSLFFPPNCLSSYWRLDWLLAGRYAKAKLFTRYFSADIRLSLSRQFLLLFFFFSSHFYCRSIDVKYGFGLICRCPFEVPFLYRHRRRCITLFFNCHWVSFSFVSICLAHNVYRDRARVLWICNWWEPPYKIERTDGQSHFHTSAAAETTTSLWSSI